MRTFYIKERIQEIKETGHSQYIYQHKQDKYNMAYGDFKDFARGTVSDKILHEKALITAKTLKNDTYQRGLASMIYRFFDKNPSGSTIKNENMSDQ